MDAKELQKAIKEDVEIGFNCLGCQRESNHLNPYKITGEINLATLPNGKLEGIFFLNDIPINLPCVGNDDGRIDLSRLYSSRLHYVFGKGYFCDKHYRSE